GGGGGEGGRRGGEEAPEGLHREHRNHADAQRRAGRRDAGATECAVAAGGSSCRENGRRIGRRPFAVGRGEDQRPTANGRSATIEGKKMRKFPILLLPRSPPPPPLPHRQ